MEEVEAGWLQGPVDPAELDREFCGQWISVQRFALQQGKKLRPIDNFSISQVNNGYEIKEYLRAENKMVMDSLPAKERRTTVIIILWP